MIPTLLVLSIPAALVAMVVCWGRSVERWDLREGEGCPPWEMWNWRAREEAE